MANHAGALVKERPLIFNGEMVRAIQEGRKTMTRRPVKPDDIHYVTDGVPGFQDQFGDHHDTLSLYRYGMPGDHIWGRETFVIENTYEYHGNHQVPVDGRPIQKHSDPESDYWLIPHYRASEPEPHIVGYKYDADDDKTRWTPSIHMPRWASRILLEIVSVRIERLTDISESDAQTEGTSLELGHLEAKILGTKASYKRGFCRLWQSLYGAGSWEANPFVWVIEFKVIPMAP